ncbi:Integrator complex subunit 3 [Boothiomyces sp. JEL0866]|nr:Integrator complex subunit 3 [Boothiomyces sp. JEL0866]
MKQIRGGDLGKENLTLTSGICELLEKNLDWIQGQDRLIKHVIFTFTRLIADHGRNLVLRQREIMLVITLIRKNFQLFVSLGRDVVRLLQMVSDISEFSTLLDDIAHAPQKLHPEFLGIENIWNSPTEIEYLVSRITPDMEYKLIFILQNVNSKLHYTYLERFRQRFFSQNGTETLYIDIIRYICAVVHPNNTILRSEVVQRWDIIRTILSYIRSIPIGQLAKFALFYDWFFYSPTVDKVMNIEPAILLIERSLLFTEKRVVVGSRNQIASNTIEFMVIMCKEFWPLWSNKFVYHFRLAMYDIIEKRVLETLASIYNSALMDSVTRSGLNYLFPMFLNLKIGELPESLMEDSILPAVVEKLPNPDEMSNGPDDLILTVNSLIKEGGSEKVEIITQEFLKRYSSSNSHTEEEASIALIIDCLSEHTISESENSFKKILIDGAFKCYSGLGLKERNRLCNLLIKISEVEYNFGQEFIVSSLTSSLAKDSKQFVLNYCKIKYSSEDIVPILTELFGNNLEMYYKHVPRFCDIYSEHLNGNAMFQRQVLSMIDPTTLLSLQTAIYSHQFQLFTKNLINFGLQISDWTSFEQFAGWRLAIAEILAFRENIQEHFGVIVSLLEFKGNEELYNAYYTLLLSVPISTITMRNILCSDLEKSIVYTTFDIISNRLPLSDFDSIIILTISEYSEKAIDNENQNLLNQMFDLKEAGELEKAYTNRTRFSLDNLSKLRRNIELWREKSSINSNVLSMSDTTEDTPLIENRTTRVTAEHAGSSILEALYHIICVVAGTGILQIPYALNQSGWIGLLFLCGSALVNHYTGSLIIKNLYYHGKRLEGYPHIGGEAFGKVGFYTVSFFYNTAMGGSVCLYLILTGMNLEELVGIFNHQRWTIIVSACLLIPFLLLKTLKEVGFVSLLGALASVVVVVIVVVVGGMEYEAYKDQVTHQWFNPKAFGSVLGTLCFSFGGNYVYPEVERSMAKPSSFKTVLTLGMITITTMYLAVGVVGYLTYGNLTVSPILLNLPPGIFLLMLGFSKTFSLAIITFHVVFACPLLLTTIACDLERALDCNTTMSRSLLRVTILSGICFLSVFLPYFADLMNLVGAVSNTMLIFILPIILDHVLHPTKSMPKILLHLFILIIGFTGGSLGTYDALLALYNDVTNKTF